MTGSTNAQAAPLSGGESVPVKPRNARPSALAVVISAIAIVTYIGLVLLADTQKSVLLLLAIGSVIALAASRAGLLSIVSRSFASHENVAAILAVVGFLTLAVIFRTNSFVLFLLVTILINMTACFGLSIQFGYAGTLNFAGAAMLGIGAYTAALLGRYEWMPGLMLLPFGGLMAALLGSVLLPPMLRTHGHYSAVITIAFTVLMTTFLDSFQPFGGSQGLSVRTMSLFGWDFSNGIAIGSVKFAFYMNHFLLALLLAVLVGVFVRRVERSWIGLNLDAVRIDETSASCFGISIASAKVFAFTVGNFIVGMAGALYALVLGYIAPSNFTFADSLILITVILLGGIGSIWGVVLTTVIVQVLPERLQAIQEYRLFIYAILVLLVLRFAPSGLIPRPIRRYFPGAGV